MKSVRKTRKAVGSIAKSLLVASKKAPGRVHSPQPKQAIVGLFERVFEGMERSFKKE